MVKQIVKKHKNVDIDVSESPRKITLSKIVVPKEHRGKGTGSKVMKDLIKYAQKSKKPIALTPSKDFGGSVPRLKKFYKSHGFVENKGKKKDYEISESMYYKPE